MCELNGKEPRSILQCEGPHMNFQMGRMGVRKAKNTGVSKRANQKRVYLGFLNVRTLNPQRMMKKGRLLTRREEKLEFYKQMMILSGLYILGISEARRGDSGEEDVGDGFVLVWQGNEEEPGRGGVAFLLSPEAAKSWRAAGAKSRSSSTGRILAITLQLGGSEGKWNIVTVYGPTSQCGEAEKEQFFSELQDTLDSFPQTEVTVIIGDFNSRVGSRAPQDCDEMKEILGPHGLGPRNANGEKLLNFCIENQLRIEHTFHPHSISKKASWYHPRFKNPGVIDMALIKRTQSKFAADVQVLPSVDTDSDHKLCRLKLVQQPDTPWRSCPKVNESGRPGRLPVDLAGKEFARAIDDSLRAETLHDMEETQKRIRIVAEEVLPKPENDRPAWQKENAERLKKLSRERQQAFFELQQQESAENRTIYRRVCKNNRREIRRMIAKWWDGRLKTMEKAAEHGDAKSLHQEVKRLLGFITKDEPSKRALSSDHEAEQKGMTEHFKNILNINRPVDMTVLNHAPDLSALGATIDWSTPNEDDVRWGIMQLHNGKAADSVGLQAELYKACVKHEKPGETCEVVRILTETIQSLWRGDAVVDNIPSWLDSILIPIYKRKGKRNDWNNWRGVVLLNIASKVHAILLNRRLRELADVVVPETQVGFRPEHGAADGVGIVRRVFECFRTTKVKNPNPEQDAGVYALFVDLAKAFDSVDRALLWQLLESKCGVPANVVAAIRNLHDGMQARTFHRGKLGEPFTFKTGVRQGSIEGPTLWNIFYCFLLLDWKRRCDESLGAERGVSFEYTLDGVLRSDTRNNLSSGTHRTIVEDIEYADDLVIFETNQIKFAEVTRILDETCIAWGAEISTKKTKWVYITPEAELHSMPDLFIRGEQIERVHEFIYLGSLVGDSYSLGVTEDIERRIAEATKIFGRLRPMWKSHKLSRTIKRRLFLVCVSTVLLYGCENWPLNSITSQKINSFWYGKIRSVLGISWVKMRDERITNERCAERFGVPDWRVLLGKRHTRWIGHIARMSHLRPARQTLFGSVHGRRPMRTGIRKSLVTQAKAGLAGLPRLDTRIWAHIAQDKLEWDSLCEAWDANAEPFQIDNPRRCPLCDSNVTNLGKHITAKHPVSTEKFECEVLGCRETFLTKNARTKHMNNVHGIGVAKNFHCPHFSSCKCGPFQWKSHLRSHLKRVHDEVI